MAPADERTGVKHPTMHQVVLTPSNSLFHHVGTEVSSLTEEARCTSCFGGSISNSEKQLLMGSDEKQAKAQRRPASLREGVWASLQGQQSVRNG